MSIEKSPQNVGGRRGFDAGLERELLADLTVDAQKCAELYPEAHRWLESLVSRIDFKEMRNVFAQIARRSGVAEEDLNFIGPERILPGLPGLWLLEEASTVQHPEINALVYNIRDIDNALKDPKVGSSRLAPVMLSQLFHEYAHISGAMQRLIVPYGEEARSGYRKQRILDHHDHPSVDEFMLFNEGVTILIEEQTVREYLRRAPLTMPDGSVLTAGRLQKEVIQVAHREDYSAVKSFVRILAQHIADASGLPAEEVHKAFVKSYYDGAGFFSEDGKEALQELVGKDFHKQLADAKSGDDILRLMRYIRMKKPPDMYLAIRTLGLSGS